MDIPEQLRYSQNHEWARLDDDGRVTVGITDFAQDALGDIVFVDLPVVGRRVAGGESFAEVESTKSVADVYAPVSGTVVAVNTVLGDAPETINQDSYGAGWFAVIDPSDPAEMDRLMDAAAYADFTAQG
ncbi:MAG: glycine cleavage system protein GcvH [Actinobacteria bacterium]|nr:MAG: glycine cleavage system protein GcvH [Actinomycetota bacterium]